MIPYTLQNTNLRAKRAELTVNLEVDLLARYVEAVIHRNGGLGVVYPWKLRKYGYLQEWEPSYDCHG